MLYICTLFDNHRNSRPLITGVYDNSTKDVKFYPIYIRGTKKSIEAVENNIIAVKDRISEAGSVVVNSHKQHILAFGLASGPRVYDLDVPSRISKGYDVSKCKKLIARILRKMCKTKLAYWHVVRADADVVYAHLQRRGVLHNYKHKYPIYDWVFSGRSKTTGFNIQGLDNGDTCLANMNGDNLFVHFDWVAADMRALSVLSQDQKMLEAFEDSDPYQYFADYVNKGVSKGQLKRNEAKKILISSIYSLDISDNPAMKFYSGLASWIAAQHVKLKDGKHLKTILGRRFKIDKDRSIRSAFNAIIQGSVAHAMQICLKAVWDIYPDSILTENHDSLVLTATKSDIGLKIIDVARIMVQPFNGILKDNNPQFPVKISIGKRYRDWRTYRRFNSYGQIG